MSSPTLKKHWYYAQIHPTTLTYEVCKLIIRIFGHGYFEGIDNHDKHSYLFSYSNIDKLVLQDRAECSKLLLKEEAKNKEVKK